MGGRSPFLPLEAFVAISRKLLISSLALNAAAWAADPSLLDLVMPDARVLAGVNVERILASPFGKEIGPQIRTGSPELRQLLEQTGFDPTRDLKEVLVASTGEGPKPPALFLIRGSFDTAKFSSLVGGPKATTENYEGVQIMINQSRGGSAVASLDNTLLIGGDLAEVRAAIHRRTHHTVLSAPVATQVATLSARYDIWGMSNVSLAELAASARKSNVQQVADTLQSIERISGGMRFSPDMELAADVETRSAKDAASVRDTLGFFSSLAAANQQNPSGLKPDAFKLSVDGRTVRIALTIPEEDLKKAYQMQMARMRAMPKPAAPAKPRVADDGGIMVQSSEKDMGTVTLHPGKKN